MIEIIPNWHPLFVHFPIAFVSASVFLIAIGMSFKTKPWAKECLIFGRWMLWAAAAFAGIAAIFGWFAYNSVNHDDAGHLAMTIHRNWALVSLGALVLLTALDFRSWQQRKTPTYGFLGLLVVAWLLVVSTAWHGGEAVFRHGLGVMSIPATEAAGHAHEHGGEGHGDTTVPSVDASHGDGHGHGDAANGTHPHEGAHADTASETDNVSETPKKSGHAHAAGTPPHKD